MARQHLANRLSGAEPAIDDVWTRYEYRARLLAAEELRAVAGIARGTPPDDPLYVGLTAGEFETFFEHQRAEINNDAMLSLLAATEAALKVDYIRRVIYRKRDAVSQQFERIYREVELQVALDGHILETWKTNPPSAVVPAAIGDFRGAFHLRNWLAHGRFWRTEFARKYDPIVVLAVCDTLLRELGLR